MQRKLSLTRIGVQACAALALAVFAPMSARADITVTVLPSLAPNAFGSPSWNGYVANALYAIENHLTSHGDPNSPTYYNQANHFRADQTIVTGFPSWMGQTDPGAVFGAAYAAELGNRMHFGLDIVASNGQTFLLDDVSFDSVSSPNPGLDWGWSAAPWTFSSTRIGIAPDGTVYNSGPGNRPIVRLMYVGSGNSFDAYCPGCTTAQQQNALMASALALGGVTYTGTYSVTDAAGATFSGSGSFTVDPVPEPSSIVLLGTIALGIAAAVRRRLAVRG